MPGTGRAGNQLPGTKFVPLFDIQEQMFGGDMPMDNHITYKGSPTVAKAHKKRDVLGQLLSLPGEKLFI